MLASIIPFCVGLVGLSAFGFVRLWEERRGARVFPVLRARLDRAALRLWHMSVSGEVSREYRLHLFRAAHALAHRIIVDLAMFLQRIERPLFRMSRRMRTSIAKEGRREPSEFLKTITPDKKIESVDTTDTL